MDRQRSEAAVRIIVDERGQLAAYRGERRAAEAMRLAVLRAQGERSAKRMEHNKTRELDRAIIMG